MNIMDVKDVISHIWFRRLLNGIEKKNRKSRSIQMCVGQFTFVGISITSQDCEFKTTLSSILPTFILISQGV